MNALFLALIYTFLIYGMAYWSGRRLQGLITPRLVLGSLWFFLFSGIGLMFILEEDSALLFTTCLNQSATMVFLLSAGVGGVYKYKVLKLFPNLIWSVLIGVGAVIVSSVLLQLLQQFGIQHQEQDLLNLLNGNNLVYWFTIILVIVLAPISEELLFRGAIQPLIQKNTSVWFSIVVTGILFGVMHFDSITAVPPLIIFGIVLGWWKERTGWVLFPIVAHLANNSLVVFGS